MTIEYNEKKVKGRFKRLFDHVSDAMALDIKQISQIKAPFKKGDLMVSAKILKINSAHKRVIYDEAYAAYQEAGQRDDGTRKVKQYTTPNTGKDFLKSSGEDVATIVDQYFELSNNIIK